MPSRRKLKKERELVADIHKTFNNFCVKQKCNPIDCEYFYADDCEASYIIDLLRKNQKPLISRGDGKFSYNQEKIKRGK